MQWLPRGSQSEVAPSSHMCVDFFCVVSTAPFKTKQKKPNSILLKKLKKSFLPGRWKAAALEGSDSSLSTEQHLAPELAVGIIDAPAVLR